MFGFDTAYLGMIRAGELIAAFFSSAIEQIYVDAEITTLQLHISVA